MTKTPPLQLDTEREVVVMLTDMIQYSKITYNMTPTEICAFITTYHENLRDLVLTDENLPVSVDPLAGDGSIIIFEKRENEGTEELCTRAVQAAIRMSTAIDANQLSPTRIGIFLGDIIEAKLGKRYHKFGSSFAVASRLETLCGFFGTTILMDREVARKQLRDRESIVSIGKVTPKNFSSPFNLFTILRPGMNGCPKNVDVQKVNQFICMKNQAMEKFCGNLLTGDKPDFPAVREELATAQEFYIKEVGQYDLATDRILDYIREQPYHNTLFESTGISIAAANEAKALSVVHLSKQILKTLDHELYSILIENTEWEKHFKLEWREVGEVVFNADEELDGIYYLDRGHASAIDSEGKVIAKFTEGSIFGEMAYFSNEKRRSATVIADSELVLRKISISDFEKLPEIRKLLKRLAAGREDF